MKEMRINILAVTTSPNGQKSQTLRLVEAVFDGARSCGAVTEIVNLCELDIRFCNGCRACFAAGRCVFRDDYQALLDRMLAADGMVWGSPNYSFCVPARMKALIDRMADVIHCQLFDGKYSVAVSTAGRDDVIITDYLRRVLLDFGSFVTGCTGAVVTRGPQAMDQAESIARELGRQLAEDIAARRGYPEQRKLIDENRREFQEKVRQNSGRWKHEYAYWEDRGWN